MAQENAKHHRIPWKKLGADYLLIACGIAANLIFSWAVSLAGWPIYLDSIGTIFVSFTGGFVPGILTGYITNLLKTIFDPLAVFYCAINVMIAVLAAFLFRREWFRRWRKALLSVPLFALIGGVAGGFLTLMLYGFRFGDGFSGRLAMQIDSALHNTTLSQICADFLLDIPDKLISLVIAMAAFRLFPRRIRDSFRYQAWLQNPLSRENYREAEKFQPIGLSLRTKVVVVLTVSIVTISAVTTGISYFNYHDSTINSQIQMGFGVTRVLISNMDPDRVDEYITLGEAAPGYRESRSAMADVCASSPNIKYVYVYRILEDGCQVVFDPDTPDTPGEAPGAVIPFDDAFSPQLPALLAGREIEPVISNETYGWLLSVYTPVRNSAGETVCYACTDIDMTELWEDECRFLAKSLSLFVGLAMLILAGFLWYAENGVILPINSMAFASSGFAFNSEEERKDGADQLRRLGIRTHDEIENLYHAITKTTDDSVRYIAESQEKNAIITRMQENLIITMADLVESRDQNTGDHIRNTSEYTRIIMDQLLREGHYTDLLTPEFRADVYRSAPLHDIGKIRISDTVLNKPGRLTDEEFAVMKLHTVYGGEVIEKTRSASPDISYLNVAKDLATYHHEWWNGRGYPEGLKGEDIPLSARIMAVADVFDALVSKRCYKDGFSFEKSMSIIREEAGTHFDPLVAQAFINASDEVHRVLESRQ